MLENKKFWWSFSLEEIFKKLTTDPTLGLSSATAKKRLDIL